MDRILVVVFDSENKAYEGKKALQNWPRRAVSGCTPTLCWRSSQMARQP